MNIFYKAYSAESSIQLLDAILESVKYNMIDIYSYRQQQLTSALWNGFTLLGIYSNIYIKTHYREAILAKIQKLEKTMVNYLSYTNHLQFSVRCHHNKLLPKELQLQSRLKTEKSKTIL